MDPRRRSGSGSGAARVALSVAAVAAVARIEELVAEHHDERVLLHFSSSNRVGGWLATHMARKHGLSIDDALAVGRRAGITKDGIET